MADLKGMFDALKFAGVRTLLQSGNVVFSSDDKAGAQLESRLEAETEKRFKLATQYFVRTSAEWDSIILANPFPREAANDPGHLLVLPLKTAPSPTALAALEASIQGRETVRAKGRTLYAYYPDGIGNSKLTVALIERKLGSPCTGRNWNTTLKIQSALASLA